MHDDSGISLNRFYLSLFLSEEFFVCLNIQLNSFNIKIIWCFFWKLTFYFVYFDGKNGFIWFSAKLANIFKYLSIKQYGLTFAHIAHGIGTERIQYIQIEGSTVYSIWNGKRAVEKEAKRWIMKSKTNSVSEWVKTSIKIDS